MGRAEVTRAGELIGDRGSNSERSEQSCCVIELVMWLNHVGLALVLGLTRA